MASRAMPGQVTALPEDQQRAIEKVLTDAGLLSSSGDHSNFTAEGIPPRNKAAMDALGLGGDVAAFSFNWKCAAARVGEAAAVAACATVPGGQLL